MAEQAAPSPTTTDPHVGRVVVSQAQLEERITALGRQITADYAGRAPLLVEIGRAHV
jgi:hypoxanthine-guanine phosphoribosyltransferase